MQYVLITKEGKAMTFYLKALALEYKAAYGGVLINEEVENVCNV